MYGKLHQRKLKEQDFLLSCEATRKQLAEYVDNQSKRVNIDSAKKLAVMQHMDYEGFRQMVLGANIFPTKSSELKSFSKGQEQIQEQVNANKIFDKKKDINIQEDVVSLQQIQGNSQKHSSNFRDFKKKLNTHYQPQLSQLQADQCYTLIKEQNKPRIQKIFNLECEANILTKIVDVFLYVINYLQVSELEERLIEEANYMIKFLQIVLHLKNMQEINLSILSKKEKLQIVQFLIKADAILKESTPKQDLEDDLVKKLIQILSK